ncbi:MAG: hypothetical protein AAFX56_08225 [Pseudomonadota bacterium]
MRFIVFNKSKLRAIMLVLLGGNVAACAVAVDRAVVSDCDEAQEICGRWYIHEYVPYHEDHRKNHPPHLREGRNPKKYPTSVASEFFIYESRLERVRVEPIKDMPDEDRWRLVNFEQPTLYQLKYLQKLLASTRSDVKLNDPVVGASGCLTSRTCFIGTLELDYHGKDDENYTQYHMVFVNSADDESAGSCTFDVAGETCMSVILFCYREDRPSYKACSLELPIERQKGEMVFDTFHLGSGHAHSGGN